MERFRGLGLGESERSSPVQSLGDWSRPKGVRRVVLFDNCIGRKRDVGGVVLAWGLGVWGCFLSEALGFALEAALRVIGSGRDY